MSDAQAQLPGFGVLNGTVPRLLVARDYFVVYFAMISVLEVRLSQESSIVERISLLAYFIAFEI